MGATFENLTLEQLCDLMCGKPEEDYDGEETDNLDNEERQAYTDI